MKLSVIMSVYNGERYLSSAVESVLNQGFSGFEFLIVDDGSKDKTADILQAYARRDERIRLITHGENKGLTFSLNEMLGMVNGEYLARMDADDVSLPGRFARQMEWLEMHPECGVLGTSYWLIDEMGRRQLACHFENDHDFLCWYLCFQNPLAHPSIMARTRLLRQAGGYQGCYRYGQDFDLWWRLSFKTRLGCLPEPLLELRRHECSVSRRHKGDQMLFKQRILADMLPRLEGAGAADMQAKDSVQGSVECKVEMVRRLLAVFTARTGVSSRALALIRRDAAARMGLLSLRHPFSEASLRGIGDSLRWDPLGIARGIGALGGRFLGRRAENPIFR